VTLVCHCNETQLPLRHPYAGQLVFSAFAGTHQDAIKKGLDAQIARWDEVDRSGQGINNWAIPYVPLDPKDLGYGYENLIRVSSQSGKAGTAYIIKQTMLLDLPRRMQVSFYKVVQEQSERTGKEMTAALITSAFKQAYCLNPKPIGRLFLHSYRLCPISQPPQESPLSGNCHSLLSDEAQSVLRFEGDLSIDGQRRTVRGEGRGPVLAILDAFRVDLGFQLNIGESVEQMVGKDSAQSNFVTFIEVYLPGSFPTKSGADSRWGVGLSSDMVTSKCRAVVSAANQLVGDMNFSSPTNITSVEPAASMFFVDGWFAGAKSSASRFLSKRFEWFMVETS